MIIDRTIEPVLALPRSLKRLIVLGIDLGLCVLTVWIAFYLRLGEFVRLQGDGWPAAVISPLIAIPIFVRFGLYRAIFRHVGWEALTAIFNATLVYGIAYATIFTFFGIPGVPRTVGLIQPILLFLGVGVARVFGRYWLTGRYRELLQRGSRRKVLIFGAGVSGRQLADAIGQSRDMEVVGFLDDDATLQGSSLGGKTVLSPDRMEEVVNDYGVSEILLALPASARKRRNDALNQIRGLGIAVRTLPGLLDVARGAVTITDLRPLEIDDLLGREQVVPDPSLLLRNIAGKTVMVTGAGGSIGSELCRQIIGAQPSVLLLVEASEFALYQIFHELTAALPEATDGESIRIVPLLGSVCDEGRMRRIFEAWRPETVYHAAAYKHVPLVEHNVVEGVRNNVIGTWTCARLAGDYGVAHFILVSTDKAVRPTNVMGASKRLAELGIQALADRSRSTVFSLVRFGNVLGSSGSVVPLFRKQIASGGPVTVTHPEITRYFMSIPEAAQLVIQASSMARGGEVFVLDMGQPMKVMDLAKRMIALSGLKLRTDEEPSGDIDIAYTGLRPGEKLYEELLIGNNPVATDHPRVMMASEEFLTMDGYEAGLARIGRALAAQNPSLVREILAELVPDYRPSDTVVDYLLESEGRRQLRLVPPDEPEQGSARQAT